MKDKIIIGVGILIFLAIAVSIYMYYNKPHGFGATQCFPECYNTIEECMANATDCKKNIFRQGSTEKYVFCGYPKNC